MNRKGFTLIELIATIVLLAVIAVISFVAINRVVEKSHIKNCQTLVNNIITATGEYVSDKRFDSSFVDSLANYQTTITAQELLDGHYFNGDLVDPQTKDPLSASEIGINIYLNRDYTLKAVTITPAEFQECNLKYAGGAVIDYTPTVVKPGDITPPTISYSLTEEKYREEKTLTITAKDDDDGNGFDYMVVESYKNGVKVDNKSISKSTSPTFNVYLEEATWRIVTTAYDFSGNKSTYEKTYIIDLSIVTPTIINPSNEQWTKTSFKLTVSTPSSGINNWQYTFNANATTVGSSNTKNWVKYSSSNKSTFTTTAFSAEQNRLVYIRACSKTRCSEPASTYIRIDKTAPTISFSIDDQTAIYSCSNGGAGSPITGDTSGSYALSGTKDYKYSATCTDEAGNTKTGSHTYKYDKCLTSETICVGGYESCNCSSCYTGSNTCKGGYVLKWDYCASTKETCGPGPRPCLEYNAKRQCVRYGTPKQECFTDCVGDYYDDWSDCATGSNTCKYGCSSCWNDCHSTKKNCLSTGFRYS